MTGARCLDCRPDNSRTKGALYPDDDDDENEGNDDLLLSMMAGGDWKRWHDDTFFLCMVKWLDNNYRL